MNENLTHVIGQLDQLIRLCKQASYEYNLAANHVEDTDTRTYLENAVGHNANLARELEERVAQWDRGGEVGLVPAAPAESVWSELGPAVANEDQTAIIAACERGQRQMLAAFAKAMEDPALDEMTRQLVRRHLEIVARLHRRVLVLRDRRKEPAS